MFDPRRGSGMGEPSLFCPQCLHHQAVARVAKSSEPAVPLLSFAGYAVPQRSGKLHRLWHTTGTVMRAFCTGKFRLKVRIPRGPKPNYNASSAPLHPRFRA